jgi:hypothetical protein
MAEQKDGVPYKHVPLDLVRINSNLSSLDRLTASVQLLHEQHGEEPQASYVAFSLMQQSSHQTYQRRQSVGPEWELLDTGWIPKGEVGYILIENKPPSYTFIPTEDVKAVDAQRVAYVKLTPQNVAGWVILPNGVFFAQAGAAPIYVRSDIEGTRLNITVLPK